MQSFIVLSPQFNLHVSPIKTLIYVLVLAVFSLARESTFNVTVESCKLTQQYEMC